jgi:tetratricopeptide (TPR) repeat protein
MRGVARRSLERIPGGRRAVPALRKGYSSARNLSKLVRTIPSRGIASAARETLRRFRGLPVLPPNAIAALREVRIARSLMAMEHTLQYYAGAVLPPNVQSAPLALVRDRLAQNGLAGDAGLQVIDNTLRDLVATHPNWSECWLEYGYLRSDQGRPREALDCYAKAAEAERLSDWGDECRDPRGIALVARMRVLAAEGDYQEAAAAYAASLALDPNQRFDGIQYGQLLRRTGRSADAIHFFLSGMLFEETRWCLPKTGRNAAAIAFSALATGPAAPPSGTVTVDPGITVS